MSILSIEAVDKSWFGKQILDQVSLRVNDGEKLALIGENGTGKTTLFKLITGQEQIDAGRIVMASGTVVSYLSQTLDTISDKNETALSSARLAAAEKQVHDLADAISLAADDTERAAAMTAYSEAVASFESMGGYDYRHRLAQILSGLGFKGERLEQPLISLSGGERMRVQMARLLVGQPDLLMLDEPTNHLDLSGIEWLEDYIQRFGGTVIFISHDRSFIDHCATRVAALDKAKIKLYSGNYSQYLAQKAIEDDFARQEVNRLKEAVARESEVVQTMLSHRKISQYHSREKKVEKLSAQLERAKQQVDKGPGRMNFHFIPIEREGDPDREILAANELKKAYGERVLFDAVDISLKATEHAVLVGPNGCGKTTLLRVLQGTIEDFEGRVRVSQGIRVAAMGQFVPFEDESLTVFDELAQRSDLPETEIRNRLARFGFTDVTVFKEIKVLSGGERARLYLCCLLEEQPDLLYLDEPTNHLDIHSRDILEQALVDFSGAILAVSHDRYFIERLAHKVYGFIGSSVPAFFNYESYRREARISEENEQAALAAAKAKQRDENLKIQDQDEKRNRVNPATLRREQAKRQNRLSEMEGSIAALETEKATIEAGFNENTEPEVYQRLADILETLEKKQDEYIALLIEFEES